MDDQDWDDVEEVEENEEEGQESGQEEDEALDDEAYIEILTGDGRVAVVPARLIRALISGRLGAAFDEEDSTTEEEPEEVTYVAWSSGNSALRFAHLLF